MHQSIPAVPIPPPPPGNPAFAHVVSPGGGAFAILLQPGGWALAFPGATPGHLTHAFSKDG